MYNNGHQTDSSNLFSLCIMAKLKQLKRYSDVIKHNTQNKYGMTCLHHLALSIASSYQKFMVTKYLLKKGANPNIVDNDGNTVLHKLCSSDKNYCLIPMICNEMNTITLLNDHNLSPLMIAAINNCSKILLYLLTKKGIDVNTMDENKKTVLHYIIQHNNIDVLTLLCKNNDLNINCKDSAGYTPLHYSFAHEFLECSKILLDNGAFVNSLDSNGNTCLHYMYNQLNSDGQKLLLKYGANIFLKNKNNEIAKDVPKKIET